MTNLTYKIDCQFYRPESFCRWHEARIKPKHCVDCSYYRTDITMILDFTLGAEATLPKDITDKLRESKDG